MTTVEALLRARELMYAKSFRMGEVFMQLELLDEVCGEDGKLKADVLKELDDSSPGKNFGFWVDGGTWADTDYGVEPVYHYDRTDAQIAAVIGKTLMRLQEQP